MHPVQSSRPVFEQARRQADLVLYRRRPRPFRRRSRIFHIDMAQTIGQERLLILRPRIIVVGFPGRVIVSSTPLVRVSFASHLCCVCTRYPKLQAGPTVHESIEIVCPAILSCSTLLSRELGISQSRNQTRSGTPVSSRGEMKGQQPVSERLSLTTRTGRLLIISMENSRGGRRVT